MLRIDMLSMPATAKTGCQTTHYCPLKAARVDLAPYASGTVYGSSTIRGSQGTAAQLPPLC